MKVELSFEQTRVLGVFLEKEVTTPEQYPLSINGITTACNQKSNRDPVVEFSESQVQNIVDELVKLRLLSDAGSGARVTKYRHRFCGAEFSAYQFKQQHSAILCVLFLRGPQTPGELRTRSQRLYGFNDVNEVEQCLVELNENEQGPFVVKLAREPGKREARYAHCFSGEVSQQSELNTSYNEESSQLSERVAQLEDQVAQLTEALTTIKQELGIA